MAWAGSLFFNLIPKLDSKTLAKEAAAAGTATGQAMGAQASKTVSEHMAQGLAANAKAMGQATGQAVGTEAGKAASEHMSQGLAANAKAMGTITGTALGTQAGKTANESMAAGMAAGSRTMEQRAADLGTKVGSAIGKPLGMALSPLGPAITGAMNLFDRLPPHVQTVMSAIPKHAVSAGQGMVTAFTNATNQSHQVFSNWSNKVTTVVGAPMRAVNNLAGQFGLSGGAALGLAGGAAIKTGLQFDALKERAGIAFETILGGADKSQKMMQDLIDFSLRTPFELPGMIDATQELLAFGWEAEQIIPTLQVVGDATAGLGGTTDTLHRITYALGQIKTRGKVMATEMLQLTNAGIPAWAILANKMGVTTGELQKMVTKGMVPASEAIPMLLDGMAKGTDGVAGKTVAFTGLMEKQYTSLSGIWARTKEAFTVTMGGLVEPAIPGIKAGLIKLQELFQSLPNFFKRAKDELKPFYDFVTGPLVQAAQNLWDAFAPVLTPIAELIGGALYYAWKHVGDVLTWIGKILVDTTGWLKEHQLVVYVVVGAVTAYATATLALNAAYLAVAAASRIWAAAQWLLNAALRANPIMLVITILGALVAAFIYAYQHSETFRQFVDNAWAGVKRAAEATWEFLKQVWAWLGSALDWAIRMWTSFKQAVENVWNGIKAAADFAWSGIQTVLGWLSSAVEGAGHAWDSLKQTVETAWNAIVEAGKLAFTVLATIVLAPFQIAINAVIFVFQELGRIAVDAWNTLKEEGQIWWEFLKTYIWDPLVNFFNTTLLPLWNQFKDNVLQSWNEIKDGLAGIWTWIRDNVFQPIVDFVNNTLIPLWHQLRDNIVQSWNEIRDGAISTWNEIKTTISDAWDWLKTNVFDPLIAFIRDNVIAIWHQLRDNVLQSWQDIKDGATRTWTEIKNFLADVWAAIKREIFDPIVAFVNENLVPLWNTLRDNVVRTWTDIKNHLSEVWNWVKSNVFDPLVKFVTEDIPGAFRKGVEWLGEQWQKVKAALREPLQIAIDIVWNKGIVAVWNEVATLVGLGADQMLKPYNLPAAARGRVVDTVPGYTPGRDPYTFYSPAAGASIALSGGEAIMRPEVTRALGGAPAVDAINAAARQGGVGGVARYLGGFATGGVVPIDPPIGVPLDDGTVWNPSAVDPLTGLQVGPSPIARVTEVWKRVEAQVAELRARGAGHRWGDLMKGFSAKLAGQLWEWVKMKAQASTAKLKSQLQTQNVVTTGPGGLPIPMPQPPAPTAPADPFAAELAADRARAAAMAPGNPAEQERIYQDIRGAADDRWRYGLKPPAEQLNGQPTGVVQMMNWLRQRFVDLSLYSGYRPAGAGPGSEHARGWSVDVPPRMDVFDHILASNPWGRPLHLAFTPAGNRQIAYGKNTSKVPEHGDHVHWSVKDRGGFLTPGWNMTYNGTGAPELVLTADQVRAGVRGGDGALIGSLTLQVPERASAKDVVDELSFALRHARRAGVHTRRGR